MSKSKLLVCALILAAANARGQTSTSLDAKVQAPQAASPQRGSLAGQLSGVVFGPGDLSRGAYGLAAPLEAPSERGSLQAAVFPRYSPEAGISEWGTGWQSSLAISRTRVTGDLDYATDDLSGPFGRLVEGADGFWYPVGLQQRVRVEWDRAADVISAYLPDGTIMTFGGPARVTNARGTYAWQLTAVRSVLGRETHLDWSPNASGRQFLTQVRYGGTSSEPAYLVDFTYEPLARAFEDYRSGTLLALDRRVAQVVVRARSATTGAFEERWRYELGYVDEGFGPGFHLASVQQVFRSGERPPPTVYAYLDAKTHLATVPYAPAPEFASVLSAFGWAALQPDKSTILDADQDGRVDLELAKDYTLARMTDRGYVFERLPAAPPGTVFTCRRSASSTNPPRAIAQLRSGVGDETSYVVDVVPNAYRTATTFRACDRVGTAVATVALTGDWSPSSTVRLADVNRDHRPDLVRVASGSYKILPNASTSTTFAFGAVQQGALSPAFTPDTAWVHDMNGDGIVDLVARSSSEIWVWYGKGNYQFETKGRRIQLLATNGATVSPAAYSVWFVDANRDGLTDVVLSATTGNSTYLFMNTGAAFQQVVVPALAAVDPYTSKPTVADVRGTGNVEVTFQKSGVAYAVALDAPGVGLLATADDGKGTVLSFDYARAPAAPGARARPPVLARVHVDSAGQGSSTVEYLYAGAKVHSTGKFLLGYDQVTKRGPIRAGLEPLGTESVSFLNEDRYAGVRLSATTRDALVPSLERFSVSTYEDATFQGIPWKRPVQEESGWRATDGTGLQVTQVARTTGWWGDLCPAEVVKRAAAGTLTTRAAYATLAAFSRSLACLPNDVVEIGAHPDPEDDFTHETALVRNDVGLVTRVDSVSGTSAWTQQTVTYTPDWLVERVSAPGLGTSSATYDPATRLVQRTTSPVGVTVDVVARDPVTGAATFVRTTRGALVHEQQFAYDGQERLATSWDNTGAGSRFNPSVTYAYALAAGSMPASIATSLLIDTASMSVREAKDLLTAGGRALVSATRIPEGWALGAMEWSDPATGQTASYLRPPVASGALAGIDVATLFAGADRIETTTAGPFGAAFPHVLALHSDVQRTLVESLALDGASGTLVRNVRENGTYDRTTAHDAAEQVVATWDEAGTPWRFERDALGRVRAVLLPDGKSHRVRYDAHGRVARVERDGVATIENVYDEATGLLREKRFLNLSGQVKRSVAFVRDGAGRVTSEMHTDACTGATKRFRYYFDGATPEAPSSSVAKGLLTAVTGEGFVKRLEYRADGKLARRTLEIGGWRTVVTELRYNAAGEPAGQSVHVYAGSTRLLSSVRAQQYDAYGRVAGTSLGGVTLATYAFDGEGRLGAVSFANGETLSLEYDPFTRRLVSSTQSRRGFSAATSRGMSDRGLVDRDTLHVGALSLSRQYGYSAQRFLTSSVDAQGRYRYEYDRGGLPTRISDDRTTPDLVVAGTTLTAGGLTYVLDDLGRTVQRGGLVLGYGPDGQLATATRGARTWTYLHDEAGQRLAKLEGGTFVAAFLPEGYLDAGQLVEPVRIAGRTVGLLRNGVFEGVATDLLGTTLADADGTARIASPYGKRDVHPDRAAAIDYVEKGFDADLGMVRMGVRDYDPEIDRFSTPDPLFLEEPERCVESPSECALYGYASALPNQLTDPSGKCNLSLDHGADCIGYARGLSNEAYRNMVQNWREGSYGWAAGAAVLWVGSGATQLVGLVEQAFIEPGNAGYVATRGVQKGDAGMVVEGGTRLALSLALTGAGTGSVSAPRFLYDPRRYDSVRREYWAENGPALGRSLHHWLFPQRWTWVPEGVRNAGFNLLELPALRGVFHPTLSLNTWMGWAPYWHNPAIALQARIVENAIRVGVPAAAAAAGYGGYSLGNFGLQLWEPDDKAPNK